MNYLTNFLALVFVLSFLVVFHEAGHFLVAKLFKFPVEVFSVGFGKRLFGFKRRETDYRVSLIPLGGYVKVVGLGPDESDVVAGTAEKSSVSGTRWQKLLVLVAGPAVNLVLAWLLAVAAFLFGIEVPRHAEEPPVVKHVAKGSPAEKAGVRVDDLILSLAGKPVASWRDVETDLQMAVRESVPVEVRRGGEVVKLSIRPEPVTAFEKKYDIGYTGLGAYTPAVVGTLAAGAPAEKAGLKVGDKVVEIGGVAIDGFGEAMRQIQESSAAFPEGKPQPVSFVVERGGERVALSITPRLDGNNWRVGFSPRFETVVKRYAFRPALAAAWEEVGFQTRTTVTTVRRLLTGAGSLRQLSGPLDIAKFSGAAARSGPGPLVSLMGLLSLQLGLLNLLPIPILDGGQIFVTLLESIARRDFSLKVKERLLQAGFVFLVLLMVAVLALDVVKNVGL